MGVGNLSLYGPRVVLIWFILYVLIPTTLFALLLFLMFVLVKKFYPLKAVVARKWLKIAMILMILITLIIFGIHFEQLLNGIKY